MNSNPPAQRPIGLLRRPIRFVLPLIVALSLAASARTGSAADSARRLPDPLVPNAGETNVAPFLSTWKARMFADASLIATAATPAQLAYDVRHYDLDLHVDPTAALLSATVGIRATVVAGGLTTLDLDFDSDSMHVDGVLSAGIAVPWSHSGGHLIVTLDRSYASGELVDVAVTYHGTPKPGALTGPFRFDTHNGTPMVWTLSEPFSARLWWPCKDQPDDKADSVDVRVTMPTGMQTASNGSRLEAYDNAIVSFVHWRERHPISTYLVSIASFAYSRFSDWYRPTPTDSMEIQFYIFPEHVAPNAAVNSSVKDMIAAFSARFGPYPFLDEKYGQAEFLWGGGMENQTCTSLGAFPEYVVAHELTHQWFGDGVTCKDFHNIWLNEGFATYGQSIWAEAKSGFAAYKASMGSQKYFGAGTVYVPDDQDVSRVFSGSLSYNKGAWVLHMLRHVLGDATFYASLQNYRALHPYGNATTEDFQSACEAVSGRPLGRYFQQWVYGEYYPAYRVNYLSAPSGGGVDVTVDLQQTQAWQLFQMPVDVLIQSPLGDSTFVAQDSLALQSFTFHMPAAPTAVQIDPNEWILRTVATALDAGGAPVAAGLRLLPPRPNPTASGETEVSFSLPAAGAAQVSVLDAAGRKVADVFDGALPAGNHVARWNGLARGGSPARGGLYWLSIQFGGERRAQKLVVLR